MHECQQFYVNHHKSIIGVISMILVCSGLVGIFASINNSQSILFLMIGLGLLISGFILVYNAKNIYDHCYEVVYMTTEHEDTEVELEAI